MMNEKWKSAFDQIHAEEALKDHTKEYLSEKIYNRRSASRPVFRRTAVLAAGLVLLFFIGGSWIFMTPTAYISIDINPSLELGINRFDRIVSVDGYNEDGDALMSLTVAGDNETQYTEILDTVKTCADGRENIQCHSGDTEEIYEAHNAGVPFGKYRAYLILRDLDPSITLDDIHSMTMREIYDLIDSYNGNQGTENTGTNTQETETGSSDTNCDPGSRSDGEHGHGGQHHGGYVEGETD